MQNTIAWIKNSSPAQKKQKMRDGTKEAPALTCKELARLHPNLQNGNRSALIMQIFATVHDKQNQPV